MINENLKEVFEISDEEIDFVLKKFEAKIDLFDITNEYILRFSPERPFRIREVLMAALDLRLSDTAYYHAWDKDDCMSNEEVCIKVTKKIEAKLKKQQE